VETVKQAFTKPLKLALEGLVEGLRESPAGFFDPLVAFWRTAKSKAEGSALPDASVKRNARTNLL
jgi:hypothetical protein